MLYGLEGIIYYIDQEHEEAWFERRMRGVSDMEKAELAFVLKLPLRSTDKELYMAMLEACAKQLRISKYRIYTVDELFRLIEERYDRAVSRMKLPAFVHTLIQIERDRIMDLKGRNFLTLKDFTKEEIVYLLDLAADVKEKKKKGIPVDNYKGKNVALIFEKDSTPHPAALLRWRRTIWEWELHIWGPPVPRWERRKV